MSTLSALIGRHQVDVLPHLDRDTEIPVLCAPQVQGDVSVRPVKSAVPAVTPVPAEGIVVATGQGGHEHRLLAPGCAYDAKARGLVAGTLTVPEGKEAFLAHDEHGYTGIGPGTYEIGTQREYAGEWRAVAD